RKPELVDAARAELGREVEDPRQVDKESIDMDLAIAGKHGADEDYQALLAALRARQAAKEDPDINERDRSGLGSFGNMVESNFALCVDKDSPVATQDVPRLLPRLLCNVTSQQRAWELIKQHWDLVAPKIGESYHVDRLMTAAATLPTSMRDDVV